jgi:hypothetical protein
VYAGLRLFEVEFYAAAATIKTRFLVSCSNLDFAKYFNLVVKIINHAKTAR